MKVTGKISKSMLEIMVFAAQAGFNGWITADEIRSARLKVIRLDHTLSQLVERGDLSYRASTPPEYCLTPDGGLHMVKALDKQYQAKGKSSRT